MNTLRKIDQELIKIEMLLSEIMLAFIIIFVFIAAFLRVMRLPLVWSNDMATLLFVWVCFIGADLAMEKNKHIGVDLLTNLMPAKAQKTLKLVTNVLAIAFLACIGFYGANLAIINVHDQFQGMEISHSWATWSAPVGCALMIRTLVKKTIGLVSGAETTKEAI
jgi:TRAP-type C4-dicarboxylate transport system permease small subunit